MNFALSSIYQVLAMRFAKQEKMTCFHCGEKMPKKGAIMAEFNHAHYPVCCHGCLAVLHTVEVNGLTQSYLTDHVSSNLFSSASSEIFSDEATPKT